MSKSMFNAAHFQSPEAAREYLEGLRWGGERVCPHCGTVNESFATKKPGVYRCRSKECRRDFSVTTKNVMASSHIKLNVWLQAFFLMASSKKGVSAHQLHCSLGVTYKTAWFLAHRIREAMLSGGLLPPMGGAGKVVESDETYIGRQDGAPKHRRSFQNIVVTLVERGGSARSFHVDSVSVAYIGSIIRKNVDRESRLHTDEMPSYKVIGRDLGVEHETVNHSREEYARGDVTANTVEGYYSIFKRGMKGIYQHCSEKHLHRYLSEFDFRYSHRIALVVNDGERSDLAIKGAAGKRLTYRQPHKA
jgi:transposase-like protein